MQLKLCKLYIEISEKNEIKNENLQFRTILYENPNSFFNQQNKKKDYFSSEFESVKGHVIKEIEEKKIQIIERKNSENDEKIPNKRKISDVYMNTKQEQIVNVNQKQSPIKINNLISEIDNDHHQDNLNKSHVQQTIYSKPIQTTKILTPNRDIKKTVIISHETEQQYEIKNNLYNDGDLNINAHCIPVDGSKKSKVNLPPQKSAFSQGNKFNIPIKKTYKPYSHINTKSVDKPIENLNQLTIQDSFAFNHVNGKQFL